MASIQTYKMWVVVYPHTAGYSYDTEAPLEVFLDLHEAEAYAAELNADRTPVMGITPRLWYVTSLSDRMDEIRTACRDEGYDAGRADERESNL